MLLLTLCGQLQDHNVLQVTLENCLVLFSTAQSVVLHVNVNPTYSTVHIETDVKAEFDNLVQLGC